jgi:ABC-type oligopeptide transport system substrate-binding subunit
MASFPGTAQIASRRGRFIVTLLLIALAAGCGRHATRVEQGVRTGTLHVNAGAEPRDFDPQTTTLPADGVIIRSLMEGLRSQIRSIATPFPRSRRAGKQRRMD